MEKINDQIDAEAKALAKRITKYDPDTDEELGQYKPKQVAYEHIVKYYKAGATPYAEKMARYEKALSRIANQMLDNGVPGCTWGDTEYDSMSFVAGYNQALSNVKCIANEALTHKTSDDE